MNNNFQKVMKDLPNMVVQLRPIERDGQWLPKGHDGNIQFSGTKTRIVLPRDRITGQLIDPLTDEEKSFVEKTLGLNKGDLNVNKEKDNFWHKYYFDIDKGGRTLNVKESIHDFLIYKIAKVYDDLFAPSWAERFHKGGTRKWAICNIEEEDIEKSAKVNYQIDAYEKFKDLKSSNIKCYEFLLVYYFKKNTNYIVPKGKTIEYYLPRIGEIIEKNPKEFLEVINSPDYNIEALIQMGVAHNILINQMGKFGFKGETVIGNYSKTIEYFGDDKNNEDKIRLRAYIDDGSRNG